MKCPVCKDITLLMTNRSGIEIDYCPECRGIWLDKGELDKLIQAEKNYSNSFDNNEKNIKPNYNNESDSNYNKNAKNKKKESFFESFDFFD